MTEQKLTGPGLPGISEVESVYGSAGAAYSIAKCDICGCPIKVISSAEGTCHAIPLYFSDRERQQVYEALTGERSRVLVLQAQADGLVRERDAARVEVGVLRRERDERDAASNAWHALTGE